MNFLFIKQAAHLFSTLTITIEHQISILEWLLKDHVTLKTGVMAAENVALISKEHYMLTVILNGNNIWRNYCFYSLFIQINPALVSKMLNTLAVDPKHLNEKKPKKKHLFYVFKVFSINVLILEVVWVYYCM